jgi:hypothetical protein
MRRDEHDKFGIDFEREPIIKPPIKQPDKQWQPPSEEPDKPTEWAPPRDEGREKPDAPNSPPDSSAG